MSFFSSIGQWSKKQVKFVTRWDELAANKKTLSRQFRLFNPFRKDVPVVRQETFEEAIHRRNLSEADLDGIYKTNKVKFNLFLGLVFCAIIVSMLLLADGHWLVIGPFVAFLGIGLSQMFNASFRAYQIKQRSLVEVSAWWKDTNEWWPTHRLPSEHFTPPAGKGDTKPPPRFR